jgi:hypothetical protein
LRRHAGKVVKTGLQLLNGSGKPLHPHRRTAVVELCLKFPQQRPQPAHLGPSPERKPPFTIPAPPLAKSARSNPQDPRANSRPSQLCPQSRPGPDAPRSRCQRKSPEPLSHIGKSNDWLNLLDREAVTNFQRCVGGRYDDLPLARLRSRRTLPGERVQDGCTCQKIDRHPVRPPDSTRCDESATYGLAAFKWSRNLRISETLSATSAGSTVGQGST